MNIEELPSDSDSSDEDYVPDNKPQEVVSEVDSDGDSEESLSDCQDKSKGKGLKRTKKGKHVRKKTKLDKPGPEVIKPQNETLDEEDKKKKDDDLWADFMKDTGFKSKTASSQPSEMKPKTQSIPVLQNKRNSEKQEKKSQASKVKVTQIFEFAGEEVTVEKEVDSNSAEARLLSSKPTKSDDARKSGGLSGIGNVLSQLGKKQKISTLEKSKLDWDKFKQEENIQEELQTYNKGKDGYLDRQDFLERADFRRFEIEKDIRNSERAKRFNSTL